jgi:outer membrane protein TolC
MDQISLSAMRRRPLYKTFFFGLFLIFLIPRSLFAQPAPSAADRLTLSQAITLALQSHPSISAARGTSRVQEARVGEAKADLYPHLDLSATYRRATANFAPTPQTGSSLNRIATSGTSTDSFNNYSAGVTLQQRIFDFGKTGAAVDAAKEGLKAREWDEEATVENVVVNVKVAYFGLLGQRHLVRVNEETVRQFEQHLKQAEGFFKIGTRPKFDVTKAEVDLTNAQLNLIQARNAAEVARVTLANAIGLPNRPIGELEELLDFKKFEITETAALDEALQHRPELLSLFANQRAGEALVRSAQRSYYPVLSGVADYTYRGQDFPLVWNWDVGFNLTFPLFSGYLLKSQLAEARANLTITQANEESLRQTILLEVRQSYLNLLEAEERVRLSNLVVRQAEENLALANGRFQAGIGNSVERTDAQVLLTNAKTSQIQALYDYKTDEARLEKAMGRP